MAVTFIRRTVKTFFIVLNVFAVLLFIGACVSPYLNPAKWWIVAFTGLLFPYLVLLLIFFMIFWLITKPKIALIPFITLLFGWKQFTVFFAFNANTDIGKKKQATTLRIVTWNIQSFNGISKNKEAKKHSRTDVVASITKLNPDIICLQEFNHAYNNGEQADNLSLFTKQYPYHFFSKDYERNNGQYQSGCIIFSKYPVVNSGKIKYPNAESLIYVDAVKGNDTVRIYTTHLQSFKFKKEDYADIEKIKAQEDQTLAASMNIIQKMKLAFKRRGVQAAIVRTETDKSPYPTIVCGDFNDVPNSYTYFKIKGEKQDAFLLKQFGIGRTFVSLAPTLRIDYILPDNHFEVLQSDLIDEDLSDHLMLVADVKLKK